MRPGRSPQVRLFRVSRYVEVWRLTCNGAFSGDYASEAEAIAAAEAAAGEAQASGHTVQVLTPADSCPGEAIARAAEPS